MTSSDNEWHVYGPPGTGKTTTAAKNIRAAVEAHGRDKVMVCSHTKAAAAELAGRDLPIDKRMLGTLHAICWRALGQPKLAETHIEEWNDEHPHHALHDIRADTDDIGTMASTNGTASHLLGRVQLYRSRMVQREAWPTEVLAFSQAWELWKAARGFCDFTDLIERGLRDFDRAPGAPSVLFVDEAQDMSALQFALVRKWGAQMERFVLIGDDDQAIYDWAGADAAHLIERGIPEERKIILDRSYRLPRAVHARALAWIAQCHRRQSKAFSARAEDGEILSNGGANWRHPTTMLDDIERRIAAGQSAMILASCAYMLSSTIASLRERGIPFHNPYRRANGAWNPLRDAQGSMLSRLRAFLLCDGDFSPAWTAKQLQLWTDLLPADRWLVRGAKTTFETWAKEAPARVIEYADWRPWFKREPFDLDPVSLAWLLPEIVENRKQAAHYAAQIVERCGLKSIEPKTVVGTIHSVKGGEADVVYLVPDLAREAWLQWHRGGPSQDSVRRVFYVGMTRARETLAILAPASGLSVNL